MSVFACVFDGAFVCVCACMCVYCCDGSDCQCVCHSRCVIDLERVCECDCGWLGECGWLSLFACVCECVLFPARADARLCLRVMMPSASE